MDHGRAITNRVGSSGGRFGRGEARMRGRHSNASMGNMAIRELCMVCGSCDVDTLQCVDSTQNRR